MIPDTTSSYTIGLMRLQFWRDTITKTLAGTPPKEPVAVLMASALSDLDTRTQGRARISKGWLLRMINSREQTLTNDPYPSIEAIESYAENTYSTLLYLTLAALPMTSVTADHVASHIGKAAGIATVLRGLPILAFPPPASQSPYQGAGGIGGGAKQGAVMLPLDVMAQTGVKEEEVLRHGAEAPGLRDAVFTVATRANDHFITVQQMLSNLRAAKMLATSLSMKARKVMIIVLAQTLPGASNMKRPSMRSTAHSVCICPRCLLGYGWTGWKSLTLISLGRSFSGQIGNCRGRPILLSSAKLSKKKKKERKQFPGRVSIYTM